jgi:dephospho-CoA kinase
MLKIGLTGGIGSGKSTVAKVFETLGIPVYYADAAAKQIMNEDEELKLQIIKTFGPDAYIDGLLNRQYLSSIVFNQPQKLEQLNALTHPATIAAAEKWFAQQKTPYAIKEAALIFESGAQQYLDYVIGVYAPVSMRIQRTMQRDGIRKDEVVARMNRQLDEEIKMRLCDYIVMNDEKDLLLPQVIQLHERLMSSNSLL